MTFDVGAARKWAQFDSDTDRLLLAACDEIERLGIGTVSVELLLKAEAEIERLRAEIEQLRRVSDGLAGQKVDWAAFYKAEAERDEWKHNYKTRDADCRVITDTANALLVRVAELETEVADFEAGQMKALARVAELEAALRPFAEAANEKLPTDAILKARRALQEEKP